MNIRLLKAGILLGMVLAVAPIAKAHHSFCVEFDSKRPFSFSGKIARIEWANPHTWVYVDIKDDKGVTQQWALHAGSSSRLVQSGWTRTTLKAGDDVAVRGYPSKDGSKRAGLVEMVFNGARLYQNIDPKC